MLTTQASKRVSASFAKYQREFEEIFPGGGADEPAPFGKFTTQLAGIKEKLIERQFIFFCDGDSTKLPVLRELTIWRYLFALNEKLKAARTKKPKK